MANYSDTRPVLGSAYPTGSVDGQELLRVEPLLTPWYLRTQFLTGIPLVSFFPHPVTGKRDEFTDEMLKEYINRAVATAELETGLILFPVQLVEKHPYDVNWWRSHGFIRLKKRPVTSVERFTFTASNGAELLLINNSWIEMGQAHQGQINLIPILPAVGVNNVPANLPTANGSAYLSLFATGTVWVPSLVQLVYTAGYPNGTMPRVLNEIIGITAAIDVLTSLGATFRTGSYSMSIDGISQSQSTPGPAIFQPRIEELMKKKLMLIERIKDLYGLNIMMDWI